MVTELTFVTGLASTLIVKYSTATMAKVQLPCVGINLPTMSMPHRWRGHGRAINYEGCAGTFNR
jgi:hypothetical protein